ncbi:hypothetical protein ARMGADRAFT_1062314 [Armillaria gallica]|uniref:Uncharacterized protein n=1 Tax=Armillaria gallica TaxID=47427 RepID=A0A2H3DLG9_ARMGA|nr:hypothetical protein ARMGADRAFT_1062314 [Armillaria gallica]
MTSRFSKCVERRLHQTASLQASSVHQLGASASQYIIMLCPEYCHQPRTENMHVTSVIGKPPFVVMASYRGVAEAWQAMQKSRHMAASLGGATEWDDKYSWEEGAAAKRAAAAGSDSDKICYKYGSYWKGLSTPKPPTPTQCYAFLIIDLSGYSLLEARIFHDNGKKLHYRTSRHVHSRASSAIYAFKAWQTV